MSVRNVNSQESGGLLNLKDSQVIRMIGRWAFGQAEEEGSLDLPDPRALVDVDWDEDEKDFVVDYLEHGLVRAYLLARSTCRICGVDVSSVQHSDGVFCWPEGLAHYVKEHSVRLPDVIVEEFKQQRYRLEDAEVDYQWWKAVTTGE
jgi:hypothetical protein